MADKVKRFSMRQMVDKLEKPTKMVPAYKFSKGATKYQYDAPRRK